MSKTTRKSTTRGRTDKAAWHFRFTPKGAALAARIAEGMTAYHVGANADNDDPDPVFTSAGVINEAIAKGLACMAVEYLHDAHALDAGSPGYPASVVTSAPPLPLPLASGPAVDAPQAPVAARLARLEMMVDGLWEFVKLLEKRIGKGSKAKGKVR